MRTKLLKRPAEAPADSMLLTSRETARVLSISERTLYEITYPRGTLKAVKLPGKVLYSRTTLVTWIADQENGGK